MTSIKMDDLFGKVKWWEPAWWKVQNFFTNWIYPAYNLRNFLFHRYDIVKLNDVKRYEYSDVVERMLYANMELIKFFIEKEKPEKHVCWYKDEEGNDVGHKYGEYEEHGWNVLFPEYKGKYILDIVKEIYNWWTNEYPVLQSDREYLLSFWCEYVSGKLVSKPTDNEEYRQIVFDKSDCPTTLDFFEGKDVKWDILDKYLDGDRNNIFVDNFISNKMHNLENEIELQKQKYLHLCIEVRPYLWT